MSRARTSSAHYTTHSAVSQSASADTSDDASGGDLEAGADGKGAAKAGFQLSKYVREIGECEIDQWLNE